MDRESIYYAPWERTFRKIITPFEKFIHDQSAGGLVLIGATALALALANSPVAPVYERVFHTPIGFNIGDWRLEYSLHHWINEGLMTLFFLLVGLEIKREVLVGSLTTPRQMVLPILAALGGMAVPALIYYAFNRATPAASGWGIAMATDIAFSVGILSLLGNHIPRSLFTFLVALAIIDDLGAVLVIALFYSGSLDWSALAVAASLLGLLVVFNLIGIHRPLPYFVVSAFLWLAMLSSGIHATLAGILTAWAIPAQSKVDPRRFTIMVHELTSKLDIKKMTGPRSLLNNPQQHGIVQCLEDGVHAVEAPLQRLEHSLQVPVAFFVVPLFALANAGVSMDAAMLKDSLTNPVALGIFLGLLLGKSLGIAGISLIAAKLRIARLPSGTRAGHIIGVGFLGGIGFTMSLFIAELGFAEHPEFLSMAKTGILFASLCAGVLGYVWLRALPREQEAFSLAGS